MKFIASAQDPAEAARHVRHARPGPGQPGGRRPDPRRQEAHQPGRSGQYVKQIPLDMDWYAENYGPALDDYTKVISA